MRTFRQMAIRVFVMCKIVATVSFVILKKCEVNETNEEYRAVPAAPASVPAAPAAQADQGTGKTAPGRLSGNRTPETTEALVGRRKEG